MDQHRHNVSFIQIMIFNENNVSDICLTKVYDKTAMCLNIEQYWQNEHHGVLV